jgi:hypothetical protein
MNHPVYVKIFLEYAVLAQHNLALEHSLKVVDIQLGTVI